MYKRCAICNSTENHDELASLGFVEEIHTWYWIEKHSEYRCNRCHYEILDAMKEYEND